MRQHPRVQANHNLQALLPSGYVEGVGTRLSDEDFHRFMQAGEDAEDDEFGNDVTGMAHQAAQPADGEGWRTQRREAPRDRNSLWKLWLRGVSVQDSRVQRLLQDYGGDDDDWPIDPWAVKPTDRVQLAHKCVFDGLDTTNASAMCILSDIEVVAVAPYLAFPRLAVPQCTRNPVRS